MKDNETIERYPLHWPEGQVRTPPDHRKPAPFVTGLYRATTELLKELRKLGAAEVIISTNVRTRSDGLPYGTDSEPKDPGVAVYFEREGRPFRISCDQFHYVRWNMRAIGLTVAALRAIQRNSTSSLLEQAFTGFLALPPPRVAEMPWYEVLGVPPSASKVEIRDARIRLATQHHPDVGGSGAVMAAVNAAYKKGMEGK